MNKVDTERTIDWLRRTQPLAFAHLNDVAAVERHFRDSADAVAAQTKPGAGRRVMAHALRTHAAKALKEIGVDEAGAAELADNCVAALEHP